MSENLIARAKESSVARFFQGFHAFFEGLSFISQHSLWKYLFFPALLSLILGSALFYFGYSFLASAIAGFLNAEWWLWVLLIKIFSAISAIFLILVCYQVIVALVITPFMGYLLGRTEVIILGKEWQLSFGQELKNIWQGVLQSLKMAFLNIVLMILASFTLFLQPLFSILITGYFLGRGAFYVVLERNFAKAEDRNFQIDRFKAEMCGLGCANILMLLVPVGGLFLAPAASICGASLLFYRKDSKMAKT